MIDIREEATDVSVHDIAGFSILDDAIQCFQRVMLTLKYADLAEGFATRRMKVSTRDTGKHFFTSDSLERLQIFLSAWAEIGCYFYRVDYIMLFGCKKN